VLTEAGQWLRQRVGPDLRCPFWVQQLGVSLQLEDLPDVVEGDPSLVGCLGAGLEELPSCVGPAACSGHILGARDQVVGAGTVGQQRALEAGKEVRRPGLFAVLGRLKDDLGAVAVGPQVATDRAVLLALQDGHAGGVGLDEVTGEKLLSDGGLDVLQQGRRLSHPAAQGGDGQLHTRLSGEAP
jgi:hypothetical protein